MPSQKLQIATFTTYYLSKFHVFKSKFSVSLTLLKGNYRTSLFILSMVIISIGCVDRDNCEELKLIDFSQNEYSAILQTQEDEIKVNTTFNIKISLPLEMVDSNKIRYSFESMPEIWIKFVDLTTETSDPNNIFKIPSTMHSNFTQYFKMQVLEGSADNKLVFNYKAELVNDKFQLNLKYTPKKKGVFGIHINYDSNDIKLHRTFSPEGLCFNFRSPLLIWEDNKLNYVDGYERNTSGNKTTFIIKVN